MTYKILTSSNKVICRSIARPAVKGGAFGNIRADESASPLIAPIRVEDVPNPGITVETVEDDEDDVSLSDMLPTDDNPGLREATENFDKKVKEVHYAES